MLDEANKYVNHKIGMLERMKEMSTIDPSNHDRYWFDRMEDHLSKDYHEFVGVDKILATYKKYLDGQEQNEASKEFMAFVKSTLDYKIALLAKIDELLKIKDMLHSERFYLKHLKEEIDKLTDVFILRAEKWEKAIGRSDRGETLDLPEHNHWGGGRKHDHKHHWLWKDSEDPEDPEEPEEPEEPEDPDEPEEPDDIVIPEPGKHHHGHGFHCPLLKCVEALKAHGDLPPHSHRYDRPKSNSD